MAARGNVGNHDNMAGIGRRGQQRQRYGKGGCCWVGLQVAYGGSVRATIGEDSGSVGYGRGSLLELRKRKQGSSRVRRGRGSKGAVGSDEQWDPTRKRKQGSSGVQRAVRSCEEEEAGEKRGLTSSRVRSGVRRERGSRGATGSDEEKEVGEEEGGSSQASKSRAKQRRQWGSSDSREEWQAVANGRWQRRQVRSTEEGEKQGRGGSRVGVCGRTLAGGR
ncbi:hypothetical protein GW17_00018088 [Ensete ventricosum]|nr:hypothetical protein GW17_00018088 [Ensete ventricosum]